MPLDATIGPARVIAIKDRKLITAEELREHRIRRVVQDALGLAGGSLPGFGGVDQLGAAVFGMGGAFHQPALDQVVNHHGGVGGVDHQMRGQGAHRVGMREAAIWSIVWVLVSFVFVAWLWWRLRDTEGLEFAIRRSKVPGRVWMLRLWVSAMVKGEPTDLSDLAARIAHQRTKGSDD